MSALKERAGGGYTIDELFYSMSDGWKAGTPNLEVVRMPDGLLTSLDNTRLRCANLLNMDVKVNIRGFNEKLPADLIGRYNTKLRTPTTFGEAALARIEKQGAKFQQKNPYGTHDLPRVTLPKPKGP